MRRPLQSTEILRDARGAVWLDTTLQDIRFGLRTVRKNPGFAITAICTLAMGIGANTAIFSVVSGVLLRPLPFRDPDRLVQVNGKKTVPPFDIGVVAYPDLEDFRKQSTSFQAMVAYNSGSKNFQNTAEPERIVTTAAERGLFRMLGVEPIAGRTFRDDDPLNVVVIGAGFWKRHFAGDPSLIGRKITLDGEGFTVIGVMPEVFQFPYQASPLPGAISEQHTEFWIPWEESAQWVHNRNVRVEFVTGLLKPGVAVDGANTELSVIAKRLEAQYPETNSGRRVRVTPLAEVVAGRVRTSLLVLLGAAGMVLLVACANVANLLLARAAARTKEVAIRAALGAAQLRLMRQFLTESILLALAGGLVGLAIATWGTHLLLKVAAAQIPRSWEIGLDWRVFAFLLVVCVVTGVGFGLAPAIAAARADVQNGLKESSGRGSAGRGHGRFRDGLVVAEVAMAFVLLIGAGLLLREFLQLQSVPTGMAAENVLTLHISPGADGLRYREFEERIQQIPGVRAAGFTQFLPLQNWDWIGYFTIDGRTPESPSRLPAAELRYVTPGYFAALGIPLRTGRGFTDHDNNQAPRVILINEALTRRYFPNEDPIGRRTNRGTIIGVVGDVRQTGLDRPPVPEIYYSVAQNVAQRSDSGMSIVVSAQVPAKTLLKAVRAAIHQVDPSQAVFNIKTMQRVVEDSLSDLNLYVWLIGLFAGLALLLAVAGIYGVISYAVTTRTQAFGIRLALGADARSVVGLVLGHGALLVGLGLAVGLCAALGLTRLLKSLLFGIAPADAATFSAVSALLASVALVACLIPAWRVTKVDPAIALRYE